MRLDTTLGRVVAALAFCLPLPAIAGDASTLAVLGFSADARRFAFEEYGVQDGSGFPYANRFYIDVDSDAFLPGSPVRVRIDDEGASVADARAQARQKGESIVAEAELAANPGMLVAFNPPTELNTDSMNISVNPRPVFPPVDKPLEFRLTEIEDRPSPGCEQIAGTRGFRLERIVNGSATVLHEDTAVPSSRGCPSSYAIGGVQTIFPAEGKPAFAVLVVVRGHGFEGPNHRWLAVTGRF